MDFTPLAFYAVVCGTLSVLAPAFGRWTMRLTVGAIVGVFAALVLPFFQSYMGY